ncbi:hypothetical protein Tco_0729546 [Tanacetum coccineum]|uniref:Uncharacterized protein n=1 Tax=Tanacetum coccineum TaxID=301880 RepID=A0ABQ4YPQ3_9ASTR
MSSDSASSEVTYTSISSHGDPLAWAVDFFRLQEPDSPEAAPASPDYVPGPEEPEQAPLSPDYVPGPEYPEYLALSDEEPYLPGYIVDSYPEVDPEEDSEDGLTESFETDEYAATPLSPPAYRTTARISIRPEAPMPFPSEEEVERLLALPPSPLISLSHLLQRNALARYWELGESSTAARPTGVHRADYGFIGTLDNNMPPRRTSATTRAVATAARAAAAAAPMTAAAVE